MQSETLTIRLEIQSPLARAYTTIRLCYPIYPDGHTCIWLGQSYEEAASRFIKSNEKGTTSKAHSIGILDTLKGVRQPMCVKGRN